MIYLVMYDIEDNCVWIYIVKYLFFKGCIWIQKLVYMVCMYQKVFVEINDILKDVQVVYDNYDSILFVFIQFSIVSSMKIIGKDIQV